MVEPSIYENRPQVKKYLAWLQLTDIDKRIAKEQWREYYEKVKGTKSYKRFFKIMELYKAHDFKLMKEFCLKAKEQLENGDWELKEPDVFDELNLGWDVFLYKQAIMNKKDKI